MSGGHYDYEYWKIGELARQIEPTTPLRKAFKAHLCKVSQACHDIEWVDSGDYGPGDEDEAIRACLGTDTPVLVLVAIVAEASAILAELSAAIEAARLKPNLNVYEGGKNESTCI